MNYSIPDSITCFESISSNFSELQSKYGYAISSSTIAEHCVQIVYENRSISRKIEIVNQTNYTDYGFSIFIYNTNMKKEHGYNIIVNVPFDRQDQDCNFIKKASQLFLTACETMINGKEWKQLRSILYSYDDLEESK